MKRLIFTVLAVCLVCCGCSPLPAAIITADAMADAANVAAPILKENCVEPMQAALAAQDKARGLEIDGRCKGPVAAYAVLQAAHMALAAVIVECAAGKCTDLVSTLMKAGPAAAQLASEIAKVAK